MTTDQPTFLATIAIFPNPIISGEGIIRVNFAQTERYNVSIINTLGQEIPIIENQIGLHGEYRLPLLSQGVYSCVVRTARGEVTTLGFIVME
ncbi:MAG: T9SS type A sorting domain-containing protein [Bacteroidetes bacterium]|nr:T9SS type A sorting domain-containing protein [Bacteroidota bacterium]